MPAQAMHHASAGHACVSADLILRSFASQTNNNAEAADMFEQRRPAAMAWVLKMS